MRKIGSATLHFLGAALFAVMAFVEVFTVVLTELALLIEQGSESATELSMELLKPPPEEPAKFFRPVQEITPRRAGNRIQSLEPGTRIADLQSPFSGEVRP